MATRQTALAADDDVRTRTPAAESCAAAGSRVTGARGDACHPRQRKMHHIGSIDLRERAVALAGVVAVVCRP